MANLFDVTGEWDALQSNGFRLHFNINKEDLTGDSQTAAIGGSARHSGGGFGDVDGRVSFNDFVARVTWGESSIGEYSGRFGPMENIDHTGEGARLSGVTFDIVHPESQATWAVTSKKFRRRDFT